MHETATDLEELLGQLAEEFSERVRRGETPDVEEYVRRYPQAADRLRRILPALALVVDDPLSASTPGEAKPVPDPKHGVLGDYRLVEEIGRGGMGVVYEAEQITLNRRVALKILPFAAVLDQRQIQRFKNEALAAAQLDHPHIVDVYGVGCERSIHFYAMRFVAGDTLAEVIAQLRTLGRPQPLTSSNGKGEPRPPGESPSGKETVPLAALSTERSARGREFFGSAARIGIEVAEALDHAHQQGVIHRDIKPANVIIDTEGKSWVTDFGLARTETNATLTMTGDLLGTLRYMSPEQALAKRVVVDHRTDIYSLGVTLYELLTLQPAYPDDDRQELLRKIAFEEPRPPRKLNRDVPEQLETIVLKAIARNANDRYETARELADDLQRYLDDKPIRAKRPGPVQVATQWMRRNSTVVASIMGLLLLSTIGTATAALLIAREQANTEAALIAETNAKTAETQARGEAEEARDQERALREDAQRQRARAEANLALAHSAVDEFLNEVTRDELLQVPGFQPLREQLLTSALEFYERLSRDETNDSELRIQLAAAHHRLAWIRNELGQYPSARTANETAIELYTQLRDEQPESLDVLVGLMKANHYFDRYDETIGLCEQILAADAQHAEARSYLADTYNSLAVDAEDPAARLTFHRQALEIREGLVRDFPGNSDYRAGLGATFHNLGRLLTVSHEQLNMYRLAIRHLAEAYDDSPHRVLWGRWLSTGLRNAAASTEDPQAELEYMEQRAAVCRKLVFENPAIPSLKGDLHHALVGLARRQRRLMLADEANRSLRAAQEILENLPTETPAEMVDVAAVHAALALSDDPAATEEADDAEAQRNADEAMNWLRRAVDAGYTNAAALRTNRELASLRERDDFRELVNQLQQQPGAEFSPLEDPELAARRQEADVLRELINSGSSDVADQLALAATLNSIGRIQRSLDRFNEAEQSHNEALQLQRELLRDDPENLQVQVEIINSEMMLAGVLWSDVRHRPEAHQRFQQQLKQLQALADDSRVDAALLERILLVERHTCGHYAFIGLWDLGSVHALDCIRWERTDFLSIVRSSILPAAGHLEEFSRHAEFRLDHLPDDATDRILGQLARHHCLIGSSSLTGDELVQLARRAIERAGNVEERPQFWITLAWALYRNDEFEQAEQTLNNYFAEQGTQTAKEFHLWALTSYLRALLHAAREQPEQARAAFSAGEATYARTCGVLFENPDNNLGGRCFYFAEMQFLRREAQRQLSGEEPPDDPWQHLILARGYQMIGEAELADRELAAATPPDGDAGFLIARSQLMEQWGRREAADADREQAFLLRGDSGMSGQRYASLARDLWNEWFVLAQAQAAEGRFADAAQSIETASRYSFVDETLADEQRDPVGELAEELATHRHWEAALHLYERHIESFPEKYINCVAVCRFMTQPRETFRNWCRAQIERFDTFRLSSQRKILAEALLDPHVLDDMSRLVELARNIEAANPPNPQWARRTLAWALLQADQAEEAIPLLLELQAAKPDNVLFLLAMAHHAIGDEQAARKWLAEGDQWAGEFLTDDQVHWKTRLKSELLQQEAHELLGVPLPDEATSR